MRRVAPFVAFLLLAPAAAADEGDHVETRRYQSLWPAEEVGYLLAEVADGALVCDPVPTQEVSSSVQRRSLGGVCFDVHAGHTFVHLHASTTLAVFTPPTFVLWWQDAEGTILESEWRCGTALFGVPVPAGSARLMALAIDGAPGCPSGPAVWGTVTARFG